MTYQVTKQISSILMEDINTPRSLTCFILLKYEEWEQLFNLRADPRHYLTAERYFRDAQATELLRKCEGFPSYSDLEANAIRSFWDSECQCETTNQRLSIYSSGYLASEQTLLTFVNKVKKLISKVLGRLPNSLSGRFGPGATFGLVGSRSNLGNKIESPPELTSEAVCLQQFIYETAWGRSLFGGVNSGHIPVRGNRFVTVPKDSTKLRGIAVEPSGNLFLQLAVGGEIRKRLNRWGLDLKKGQEYHRLKAMVSSRDGTLATIDLSNASDNVSTALVEMLLPPDWFTLLNSLRSPETYINGQWVKLSKFSSMGNGFTFELETLLFWALARTCCSEEEHGDVSAYGDDIIVPTKRARTVLNCLSFFGFSPNEKKTFIEGPFRESCGGDFFNGVDVRPYQLKKIPVQPSDWIAFFNGLNRRCLMMGRAYSSRTMMKIRSLVPRQVRKCVGPTDLGDIVFHLGKPTIRSATCNWLGIRTKRGYNELLTWQPVAKRIPLRKFPPLTQLAMALYGVPSTGLTPRGWVSGYRHVWVSHPAV